MGLTAIPMEVYADFAQRLFVDYGKQIAVSVIHDVYTRLRGCTWYVQMMMNELFAITPDGGVCDVNLLPMAWDNIMQLQENSYREQLALLAPKQKALLQAVARDREVEGITTAAFVKRHHLTSASSVQAALKALLRTDIITAEDGRYRIYDEFFAEWVRRNF